MNIFSKISFCFIFCMLCWQGINPLSRFGNEIAYSQAWPASTYFHLHHVKCRRMQLFVGNSIDPFFSFILWLNPKSPHHFAQQLQHESHKPYSPTAVTQLQPLYKRMNTDTPTTRIAETHLCAGDFTHSPCFWHQSRFSNITWTWSCRLLL